MANDEELGAVIDMFSLVREFHVAFAHPVSKIPISLPSDRRNTRASWLSEEVEEFRVASTIEDQSDALIDLLYFSYGTLVEMGVRPEMLFNIVHKANMSKLDADGNVILHDDGKIAKPPQWEPPEPEMQRVLWQKSIDAFTFPESMEHSMFVSRDCDCLPACIALSAVRVVGLSEFDANCIRALLGSEIGPDVGGGGSDLKKGVPVDIENWNLMTEFHDWGIEFEYQRANTFPEWEFDTRISEALAAGKGVIATFSAGRFFNHDRVDLGHAVIVSEINGNSLIYFDTAEDNYGFHTVQVDDLYSACRYRDAGLLIVSKKTTPSSVREFDVK